MMEEESHTSLLPGQCFFLSRLKKFTKELRGFSLSYRLSSRNLYHAIKCLLQPISYLSAHREVPMGTTFPSVISFCFKSHVQFPDRKSEQRNCEIYQCDHFSLRTSKYLVSKREKIHLLWVVHHLHSDKNLSFHFDLHKQGNTISMGKSQSISSYSYLIWSFLERALCFSLVRFFVCLIFKNIVEWRFDH